MVFSRGVAFHRDDDVNADSAVGHCSAAGGEDPGGRIGFSLVQRLFRVAGDSVEIEKPMLMTNPESVKRIAEFLGSHCLAAPEKMSVGIDPLLYRRKKKR